MRFLRTLISHITRRFERRGEARYEPERDPDVRALRLQRRQSERAERRIRRNPVEQLIFPEPQKRRPR